MFLSWVGGEMVWLELLRNMGGGTDPGGEEKSFWGSTKFRSLWSDKVELSREHTCMRGCTA